MCVRALATKRRGGVAAMWLSCLVAAPSGCAPGDSPAANDSRPDLATSGAGDGSGGPGGDGAGGGDAGAPADAGSAAAAACAALLTPGNVVSKWVHVDANGKLAYATLPRGD